MTAEVQLSPQAIAHLARIPELRRKVYRDMIAELERPRADHDQSGIKDASNVLIYMIGQDISESRASLIAAARAVMGESK